MEQFALDPVFQEWFRSRPQRIQNMVLENPPWDFYTMNNDGDLYQVYSYWEDGTVTVTRYTQGLTGTWCPLWRVFGVDPASLVKQEVKWHREQEQVGP